MSRRWLISVSLAAHVALGIFLFATGVWRLERLEGDRMDLALAVMLPPAAPEGGPPPGAKPKDPEKKPVKKKVDEVVQPEEVKPEKVATLPEAPDETGIGAGSGSGSGSGSGTGTGEGSDSGSGSCLGDDCVGDETAVKAICGNGILETSESCDDGNTAGGDGCSATCGREPPKTAILPPALFQGLRISGETQIHPSDVTKSQMLHDGANRTLGTVKLCIAVDGSISSTSLISSTKYAEYDAKLVSTARTWRYRPYTVNGRPMPACSAVTFVYTIQ